MQRSSATTAAAMSNRSNLAPASTSTTVALSDFVPASKLSANVAEVAAALSGTTEIGGSASAAAKFFQSSAYDITAARDQATNKDLNAKMNSNTASVDVFVTRTYLSSYNNGPKERRYVGTVCNVLSRPEKDDTTADYCLNIQRSPFVAWDKAKADSIEEKLQYTAAYFDFERRDDENNQRSQRDGANGGSGEDNDKNEGVDEAVAAAEAALAKAYPKMAELLLTASMSPTVRNEYLPSCQLKYVPWYAPNQPPDAKKNGKNGAAKKTGASADKGSRAAFAPLKKRSELATLVKKWFDPATPQSRIIVDSFVSLIHTIATYNSNRWIDPTIPINFKHQGGGVPLLGFGTLRLYELKSSVRISPGYVIHTLPTPTTPSDILLQHGESIHKCTEYLSYESHDVLDTFPDPIFKSVALARGLYASRVKTLQEYEALARVAKDNEKDKQSPDLHATLLIVPKNNDFKLRELSSGMCLSYNLAPGVPFSDPSVLRTAKSKFSPAEYICFRGYASGIIYTQKMLNILNAVTGLPCEVVLNSQAVFIKTIIYKENIGPAFGIGEADLLQWDIFASTLLRGSELLLLGSFDIEKSREAVVNQRHLKPAITRDAAEAFVDSLQLTGRASTTPNGFTTITCTKDAEVATAIKLIDVGYGQDPIVLAFTVDRVMNDLPKMLREFALPVTKKLAIMIYNEWVINATSTGLGCACTDASVLQLSKRDSNIQSVNEDIFNFYVVSSSVTARDLGLISSLTPAHTTLAFSDDYRNAAGTEARVAMAKEQKLGVITDINCLTPEKISSSAYLIYAVKRTTATQDEKQKQKLMERMTLKLRYEQSLMITAAPQEDDPTTTTTTTETPTKPLKRKLAQVEDLSDDDDDDGKGTSVPPAKRAKLSTASTVLPPPLLPRAIVQVNGDAIMNEENGEDLDATQIFPRSTENSNAAPIIALETNEDDVDGEEDEEAEETGEEDSGGNGNGDADMQVDQSQAILDD